MHKKTGDQSFFFWLGEAIECTKKRAIKTSFFLTISELFFPSKDWFFGNKQKQTIGLGSLMDTSLAKKSTQKDRRINKN